MCQIINLFSLFDRYNYLKKLMAENLSSFSNNIFNQKMSMTMSKILNTLDSAYMELQKEKSQNSSNSFLQRISMSVQPVSLKDELSCLIRGYIINKHSKGTSKSNPKFIYISEDLQYFCWKSLHKNDEKRMETNQILRVASGFHSINFIKSQTVKNPENCIVVVGKNRSLEIQCSSSEECDKIAKELTSLVQQGKKMRYSYRI